MIKKRRFGLLAAPVALVAGGFALTACHYTTAASACNAIVDELNDDAVGSPYVLVDGYWRDSNTARCLIRNNTTFTQSWRCVDNTQNHPYYAC